MPCRDGTLVNCKTEGICMNSVLKVHCDFTCGLCGKYSIRKKWNVNTSSAHPICLTVAFIKYWCWICMMTVWLHEVKWSSQRCFLSMWRHQACSLFSWHNRKFGGKQKNRHPDQILINEKLRLNHALIKKIINLSGKDKSCKLKWKLYISFH